MVQPAGEESGSRRMNRGSAVHVFRAAEWPRSTVGVEGGDEARCVVEEAPTAEDVMTAEEKASPLRSYRSGCTSVGWLSIASAYACTLLNACTQITLACDIT